MISRGPWYRFFHFPGLSFVSPILEAGKGRAWDRERVHKLEEKENEKGRPKKVTAHATSNGDPTGGRSYERVEAIHTMGKVDTKANR